MAKESCNPSYFKRSYVTYTEFDLITDKGGTLVVTQDPNLAQANGSPALATPSPNLASYASFVGGNDPLATTIHNAILLGWSIMELKSRVQIAASNVLIDSIIFNQQNNSFIASITGPLPNDGTMNAPPQPTTDNPQPQSQSADVEVQPDVIDALLKNVILSDIEPIVSCRSHSIVLY